VLGLPAPDGGPTEPPRTRHMGWLVGKTPAQVSRPSSSTEWVRANEPSPRVRQCLCSFARNRLLDTHPSAQMPAASGFSEESEWGGRFLPFRCIRHTSVVFRQRSGGEPLIRRTVPSPRCERLKEARRRGDQAFVPSLAGSDSRRPCRPPGLPGGPAGENKRASRPIVSDHPSSKGGKFLPSFTSTAVEDLT
jgi:hypothetical protein